MHVSPCVCVCVCVCVCSLLKLRRWVKKKLFLWKASNSGILLSLRSARRALRPLTLFSDNRLSNIVRIMYIYTHTHTHTHTCAYTLHVHVAHHAHTMYMHIHIHAHCTMYMYMCVWRHWWFHYPSILSIDILCNTGCDALYL